MYSCVATRILLSDYILSRSAVLVNAFSIFFLFFFAPNTHRRTPGTQALSPRIKAPPNQNLEIYFCQQKTPPTKKWRGVFFFVIKPFRLTILRVKRFARCIYFFLYPFRTLIYILYAQFNYRSDFRTVIPFFSQI